MSRLIAIRRNRMRLAASSLCAVALCVTAANQMIETELLRIGPPPLAAAEDVSTVVLDRNGKLLRPFTTKQGRWRLPVEHTDVDQRYLKLLFAFEDNRFYGHGGVDPLAMMRAGGQFLWYGRIVSGASTLTMQAARLLDQRHERSASGKWHQILRAIQLERRLGKNQILDLYLRLAPLVGTWKEYERHRLPISAKNPNACRWGRRRCSLHCRNRRKPGGQICVATVLQWPVSVCWRERLVRG